MIMSMTKRKIKWMEDLPFLSLFHTFSLPISFLFSLTLFFWLWLSFPVQWLSDGKNRKKNIQEERERKEEWNNWSLSGFLSLIFERWWAHMERDQDCIYPISFPFPFPPVFIFSIITASENIQTSRNLTSSGILAIYFLSYKEGDKKTAPSVLILVKLIRVSNLT